MRINSTKLIIIIAGFIFVAVIIGMIVIRDRRVDTDITADTTKVGLVIVGPKDDSSYNQAHYEALMRIKDELNLEIICRENVPEDETSREVMEELIETEGCEFIIGASFGYGEYIVSLAKEYPEISFLHPTGTESLANLSTCMGRMYQARYLAGIVAGKRTKTGKIGYFGNDAEAYLKMLRLFSETADKDADEIESIYRSGDLKNATIRIHALKSTARTIGAMDVGEFAQRLEEAGKAEDTGTLDAELDALLSRYRKIGELLSPLTETEEEDDRERPLIDAHQLNEYLDRIKILAEDCDDIGIEEILTELSEFRIPEEEKERIEKIKEASENFDFSVITEILS